ncbi:MAG: ERF family protein, partial [Rhodocyclaceae bacterium]|nr:ERF family protein [Rhodocyclaceae bacterium]
TPALNAALAKAQAVMTTAAKGAVKPHFKSRYADLASVWEAWRAAWPPQGLAVVQTLLDAPAGMLRLETVLLHASGEERRSTLSFPVAQSTPQAYGSALTYARRYALSALVGIVADEDDDGNAASGRPSTPPRPASKPAPAPKVVEQSPADELRTAIGKASSPAELAALVAKLRALPEADRAPLRDAFNGRMAEVQR